MIEPASSAASTPLEIVLRARRAGIRLWITDEGAIRAKLPSGTAEVPAWLRAAKAEDEDAFGFAVAVCEAMERSGQDPERLRNVTTIEIH